MHECERRNLYHVLEVKDVGRLHTGHCTRNAGGRTPHGMCTPFPVIRCVKASPRVGFDGTIVLPTVVDKGAFSLVRAEFVRLAIVG